MKQYQTVWKSIHTGVEIRNAPMPYDEAKRIFDWIKENPNKDLSTPRLTEADDGYAETREHLAEIDWPLDVGGPHGFERS